MFGIKRSPADKHFSDLVREKADWCCTRCRADHHTDRQTLHLSHFWSRRNKSVRFDEENAAALCFSCHRYFTENPSDHSDFFLKRLGREKYEALGVRARTPAKVDEKTLAFGFKLELARIKAERKVLWG